MERARDVVDAWPEGGRVVAMIADPADPEWTGRAALKLIRAVSERLRPAFLLDLAPESSNLTTRFGAMGSDGFAEAAAGDATLAEIAHRRPQIQAAYLPSGVDASGEELAVSPALAALADRVRGAGGVLLVLLSRRAAERAAEAGWPDGWLLLGDPESARGGEPLPGDLPEMGRVERSESAPSSRWRRHRESRPFPAVKVAGGILLLAGLAAGWWWYAERATVPGDAGDAPPAAADSTGAGDAGPGEDSAGGVGPEPGPGDDGGSGSPDGASEEGANAGTSLEFSVLIASYGTPEDARERVRGLSDRIDGVSFVAPTPVQGTLWHRVYAGSLPDRQSARALMDRLVETGAKDETRAWDVRPVPWSFRLSDDFEDRSAALDRVDALRGRGLPAYVLPASADGPYRVYSGAFESRDAARALEEQLREADVEAELVRRAGVSP